VAAIRTGAIPRTICLRRLSFGGRPVIWGHWPTLAVSYCLGGESPLCLQFTLELSPGLQG
jgi:hypothetical protein